MQLFNLDLNGHSMAVPARHIARVKTRKPFRLHNHVFKNLIDRVANMDITIGIGRPVVKGKDRAPKRQLAKPLVEAFCLPILDPAWLALGQVASHRKGGVGELQGCSVVGHWFWLVCFLKKIAGFSHVLKHLKTHCL